MFEELKKILLRDLNKLRSEIELYRDEEKMWQIEKRISNSAGTLCVHLTGSLNHFIGAQLGHTGYIRNREFEFLPGILPKAVLIKGIEDVMEMVSHTLENMKESQLKEVFPQLLFDEKVTTGYLLTHVVSHLNYHLGQINYHRRLLDNFYDHGKESNEENT
ncbi:DinB family protein [Niastella yeongjuensis]|nr:DinB family protein [Niastella yeongjuensis]SEP03262.1 Protein of unknown function [Niastella yeongjuensis]